MVCKAKARKENEMKNYQETILDQQNDHIWGASEMADDACLDCGDRSAMCDCQENFYWENPQLKAMECTKPAYASFPRGHFFVKSFAFKSTTLFDAYILAIAEKQNERKMR